MDDSIRRIVRFARPLISFLPVMAGCSTLPLSASSRKNLEASIVFHPRPFSEHDRASKTEGAEDVWITNPSGLRLNGRFAEAEHPRAIVLYAEGNAGNLASRDWILRLYRDRLDASVLIFDYRGYGRSEGTPSEAGILEDARAARRWLAERAGVAESEIVLVGQSLGGGVMVDLAAEDGCRGLVLENTFSSLPDVAASHFRFFPVRRLMTMSLDSQAKIGRYHGPLLQTHGESDEVIPFSLGMRLFDRANEPKQFVRVPSGHHNDPPTPEYLEARDRFLDSLPTTEPRPGLREDRRSTDG